MVISYYVMKLNNTYILLLIIIYWTVFFYLKNINKLWLFSIFSFFLFFLIFFLVKKVYAGRSTEQKKTIQQYKDLCTSLERELSEHKKQNISQSNIIHKMESYRKEYIGNISHEMKTPLFSIQGYVDILQNKTIEDPALREKYFERVNICIERLTNIIQDLDMMNQLEAGEIQLNISSFDLVALIKEVFDILELKAFENDAKLELDIKSSTILVKADKQKIAQVFINLITNAIAHSNREKIKIKIVLIESMEKVLIQVKDNGMGIKPEMLPRIFERFFRAEASRNRKDGGSGLGLAIVKHIINAHDENISVDSVYLEGTAFSFMLKKDT